MTFNLSESIDILERTPELLHKLLIGLPDHWLHSNEGPKTWNPYDIVGHLIHGEKTDWMIRANIILGDSNSKTFEPFDRFAQENDSKGKTIEVLLAEFSELRSRNLIQLKSLNIQENDLDKTGVHPELGEVSLKELLSCWVVHDLGHIAQITRVMSKQYKSNVGPWKAYLGILKA